MKSEILYELRNRIWDYYRMNLGDAYRKSAHREGPSWDPENKPFKS